MKRRQKAPLEERFQRFVAPVVDVDACWLWTGGTRGRDPHGQFYRDGHRVGAHRVAWELANGRPVPDGMFVLHHCDNGICVNPAHLYIGTQWDNMRDLRQRKLMLAGASAETHCIHGHEFTAGNTYIHPKRRTRHCRTCARARTTSWRRQQEVA